MYENWKNSVLGIGLDMDAVEGNQCVDVPKSWVNVLFPQAKWQVALGFGNAKDMFNNANPQYFDKIRNDHNNPAQRPIQGDIAVFAAQDKYQRQKGYFSKFDNPFGHVGIVDGTNDAGLYLVQQDGSVSNSKTFVGFREWRYTELIGWLRPRVQAAPPTPPPAVQSVNGVPQVGPSVVGRILWLKPHVARWRVYPTNKVPKVGNEKAFVCPAQFGGLSYKILAVAPYPQTVTIKTEMFGVVNIYVDADAEIR